MKAIKPSPDGGFTLVEVLIVTTLLGLLTAIAAPGWLQFVNQQRLKQANDRIYLALRTAQSQARQTNSRWQASFRQNEAQLEWAIHPADIELTEVYWESIPTDIQFDADNTTLARDGEVRRVQFSDRGHVVGQLGRVTLIHPDYPRAKRCTFVSTLLGAIRQTKDEHCDR